MRQPNYWLDLFTARTWEEFNVAGASVSGFREKRCKTVQQVKPGDYVLCYLTGISRFIGALTVTSEAYKDKTPIWEQDPFPFVSRSSRSFNSRLKQASQFSI